VKKLFLRFSAAMILLITGCDLFQNSLADYLREPPAGLRLNALWAEHNSQIFYPLEAPEPGRDTWTIVVTPAAGIGVALHAGVQASSKATVPAPWITPSRSSPVVEGMGYWKYRDNEKKQITVTTAKGVSKIHTVTIIWAKLIDDPGEIRKDLSQDYYLKPGPPIELSNWLPLGAAAAYSSGTAFSGSLRGSGRTIRLHGFEAPSGYVEAQGLFGTIQRAWIEDLHVESSAALSAKAMNAGILAGVADESIIQRVKVSGGINNFYVGSETNVGGITGGLAGKAVIRDSISTANVSGTFRLSIAGTGNAYEHFYIGGITGIQGYSSGGYVFNTRAGGNVIASSPATAGGISGGGGYGPSHAASNSNIKGCVAVMANLDAGGGRADYILGRWGGPTSADSNDQNYRWDNISISQNSPVPPNQRISGVPKTEADLKQRSTYAGLGWDFGPVWKMGAGGYPALIWE
jgi:hypothetical protein